MHPFTENILENSIKFKEAEISNLTSSKYDAIRNSPRPKSTYISGLGIVDLNMDDVKRSEREINYIQSKIDEKHSEVKNLKDKLSYIKTSTYVPPSYIGSSLQTEIELEKIKLQQTLEKEKAEREHRLTMIELERKIKERETEELLEMARLRARYGSTIESLESRLLKSKIELETAQKSLQSRETFYEKELQDLDKTEKYLRDSLLNLWSTYGVKKLPKYEDELENKRKEVQIKKANYEARLRELRLDPLWTPSFIKSSVKTPEEFELEVTYNLIKDSENKIKGLEEKKLMEAYGSPRKITLHMQIEDELDHIQRLKRNLEVGKSKWEVEQTLYEAKRKDILSKTETFNPDLVVFKSDLDAFKVKSEVLVSKISNSKASLDKSVYSPSHSIEFDKDKIDLNLKNNEVDELKSELARLKIRYSTLGYPTFTSLYEFSKLESDLKQREIEINLYLKEKDRLRDTLERIRKDELFPKSVITPIVTETFVSKSPYVSMYVNPSNMVSPSKYTSVVDTSYFTLQKYYEDKSNELRALMEANERKILNEEALRRQKEIIDLKSQVSQKDKEIEQYISLGWIFKPEYQKLKEDRELLFKLYLTVKNDLSLLEVKIGTPAKYRSPFK